jgi:RNA polymerase sigma-70 factor (ECF subfamily)
MNAITAGLSAAPRVDEGELVARLQAGDASALDVVMDQYASRIYRLARGITRNEADAEEVVQDVLFTLIRKSGMFEGRSALGSWIYRITTNTALNKRRGKRAEREVPLEDYLPVFEPDGHRAGDPAFLACDWSRNPEKELLSTEARTIINETIDLLPEHYRTVLTLRDVEELTNEEVAELLGETIATVKSKLHRARMALRERLTHHFGSRPRR